VVFNSPLLLFAVRTHLPRARLLCLLRLRVAAASRPARGAARRAASVVRMHAYFLPHRS
jgi:hypothetical protein